LKLIKVSAAVLVLVVIVTACTKKATQSGSQPNSEAPRISSVDVVKVTPQEVEVPSGGSAEAIVHLKIDSGYHVNANPPTFPYLKATELEIPKTNSISVDFLIYPDPISKKFPFADKPLAVYEGDNTIKIRLKALKGAPQGKQNLPAKLRVQACDEQVCYAPGELSVSIPVDIE